MTPPRYYSYDPDQGLQWWDTEAEAREAVADVMRYQRAAMVTNDGWSSPDVASIQWGAVACTPRQTMREIDLGGGMVDYVLEDASNPVITRNETANAAASPGGGDTGGGEGT